MRAPRRHLRRAVETSPFLADCYRALRDLYVLHYRRPRQTPQGFRLLATKSMTDGSFEPGLTGLCLKLLPRTDLFVDVGANVGYYTCLARQSGTPVVAVEPSARNLRFLLHNLTVNGWLDAEVWPVALGPASGLGVLHGSGGGSSLIPGWKPDLAASHRQTVPLTRLDAILDGRFAGQRLLIKVDVEGSELGVLEGAVSCLRRRPAPWWVVEVHLGSGFPGGVENRDFERTFERFWELGYRSFGVGQSLTPVGPESLREWRRAARGETAAADRQGSLNYLFTQDSAAVAELVAAT